MKKMCFLIFFVAAFFVITSCSASDAAEDYSKESDIGNSGTENELPGDSEYTGDAGDTGNSGDYGDYGDTGDTGNTGNTGNSGEVSDSNGAVSDEEASDEDSIDNEIPDDAVVGDLLENQFVETATEDTSTFSIDVDTASYSLVRNYIMQYNQMPPVNGIRIEELVNYFDYDYPQPEEGKPFSVTMEMADSPWRDDAKLVMFGLQGKKLDSSDLPASNLVFLLDVSGSMSASNKLPLLKTAFKILVDKLTDKDTVSIVTYAGSAGVVLDSVPGSEKTKLKTAIDDLTSGGSTAGAEGIITAYELAQKNVAEGGNNRVILATDGDFNVGPSSDEALVTLIEEERDKGVFLTILGFGMGNYQDEKMELLSNAGNGNYFYIDTEKEAEKVFVFDLMGNMFTIAKDVKLQVVFNSEKISKYRLIGYENRVMPNQDFNDDTKDAGEIGSGHRVTAFYEVILTETETENIFKTEEESEFENGEFLLLKMRYKEPDEDISKYMDTFMTDDNVSEAMSQNMGFASSVVEFGMLIRKSQFTEDSSYDSALARGTKHIGEDTYGYRGEFLEMIEKAKELDK